jgi:hypothetical protein
VLESVAVEDDCLRRSPKNKTTDDGTVVVDEIRSGRRAGGGRGFGESTANGNGAVNAAAPDAQNPGMATVTADPEGLLSLVLVNLLLVLEAVTEVLSSSPVNNKTEAQSAYGKGSVAHMEKQSEVLVDLTGVGESVGTGTGEGGESNAEGGGGLVSSAKQRHSFRVQVGEYFRRAQVHLLPQMTTPYLVLGCRSAVYPSKVAAAYLCLNRKSCLSLLFYRYSAWFYCIIVVRLLQILLPQDMAHRGACFHQPIW